MNIIVLGAGMMGRAIAFDLHNFSKFDEIVIADKDKQNLKSAEKFLDEKDINYLQLDVEKTKIVKKYFQDFDIVISAVPYKFNYFLAKTAIETNTNFLDLGGNNDIVKKELSLFKKAKNKDVTVIPDCGLAPGLTSIITKEIVENMDVVNYVKLRVGGLPKNPKPPLNYQLVFSPYGLINEYVEDAIVLNNGKILKKKSMTQLETIKFPKPFGELEAFLTSGGCSTLPYTYKKKVDYLDYKTIRYKGHCEKFKIFLDMGFAKNKKIKIGNQTFVLRDVFASLLINILQAADKDVVLLRVLAKGNKNGEKINLEYNMIDYYDEKNDITAMMRTTGYPVSILAQMIEKGLIKERGVFCCEEIVPCKPFFEELKKRDIKIKKKNIYRVL
jgi:lysine 6-dehydrogenase